MPPCFRSRTRNFGVRLFFCRVRRVLSVAGRAGEACCGRGLLPPVGTCGGGHRPGSCFPGLEPEMRRADSEEFGRVWKSRAEPGRCRWKPAGGGDNHRAPEKRTRRSSNGSARLVFVGIGFFFLFSPSLSPWSGIRKAASATRCQNGRSPHLRSPGSEAPGPDQNGRSSTSAGVEA